MGSLAGLAMPKPSKGIVAVDEGSNPVLSNHNNIPWSLMLDSDSTTVARIFLDKLNTELAAIWTAMSQFCTLLNGAAENQEAKVIEETFLHSMGSIMYPLLHQSFQKGSLDETVRLDLLAFSSPTFLH
ncbi:hypothetical protein PISL3812_07719 [Talaromyces islandicus]|uniref:Uncharacterized protein n=1 Tax=Talaromyces islandicus TaxID=28573 RepID=A0A0U1M538_TALIS|nr:hypothetical protein PISL3812_07719 [Talaromyces islandicus]